MKKFVTMALAVALTATVASAYSITGGGSIDPASGQTIDLTITSDGTESIDSSQICLQFGDSGIGAYGGTDTFPNFPKFTSLNVSGAGTFFGDSGKPMFGDVVTLSADLAQIKSASVMVSSTAPIVLAPTLPNGTATLAVIGLDATGVTPGNYALKLDVLGAYFTTVGYGAGSVSGTIANGVVTVLPEPATALLLLAGLPFLRRRR